MRAALKAAVLACSGLTAAGTVEWKGTKQAGVARPFPRVNLSIASTKSIGVDEIRYAPGANPEVDDMTANICGPRTIIMTVRVESDDQADTGIANQIIDRILVRLGRKTQHDALYAANLSYADYSGVTVMDGIKLQDRILSVAAVDITFNAVENDMNTDDEAGNWVQSGHVYQNQLKEVDGTNHVPPVDFEVSR
jgi:hypothetical protein